MCNRGSMNRIVAPVPVPAGTLNVELSDGGSKSPPIHAQKSSPVKYTRIMAPVPVDIKFNKARGRTMNQINETPHRVQHLKTMKKVTVKRRQSLDRLKDELQTILDNNLEKPNSGVGSTDIAQADVNLAHTQAREMTSNSTQQYRDEFPLQEIPQQMEPCIQPMIPSKSVPAADQDKLGDGRILKYIKQQRIKRKVQLKAERSEKMNLEQARKQRLKELQDKTLKILAENIKHRKSDKKLKTTHSMVVPVPSIGHQGALKHQSVYSNKKPVITKASVKSKSPSKKQSPQREQIKQVEHVQPQQVYDMKLIDELKQTMQERIEQLSNVIETISNTKLHHLDTVTEEERSKSSIEVKMTEKTQTPNKLHQDQELMLPGEECISQNFIDTLQFIELNRQATKIQACVRGYLQRKRYKKLIVECRPLMLNCQKYAAKSMQTEIIPHWLHHGTLKPCPYNFISAVKRKLNLAVAGRVPYSEHTSHISYSDPTVSQKLEDNVMFQIQSISAPELQSPNDINRVLTNEMRDEPRVVSHNDSVLPDDNQIQLSDVDEMKSIKISDKQSGSSSIRTSIKTDHYDNTFMHSTSRNDDLNDLNGSVNNIAQSKSIKCLKSDRIFSEKSHSGYNIKLKDKLISDIKTLNDLNTTFSAYNNAANDTSMEISSIHSDIQSSGPEHKSRSKTVEQNSQSMKSKVPSELDGSSKLCTNIETISRTRSFIKSDQIVLKSPEDQNLPSRMNSSVEESLKTLDETQSNPLTKNTFKNTLSSVTENINDSNYITSQRSRHSQQYTSDFDQSKNFTRESQIENLTRPTSSLKIDRSKFGNGTKYSSLSDSAKSKKLVQKSKDDTDIKTVIKYIENLKSLSKTYLESKVTQTSLKSEEPELVELHYLKNTKQDGFESNSRTLTEMADLMKHKSQNDDCVSGNVLEDLFIPPLDLSKIKSTRLISSSSEFSFCVGPNARKDRGVGMSVAPPQRMSYDLRTMSTDNLLGNAVASDASTSTIMSSKRVVFTKTHSSPKNNGSTDHNEYSAVINLDKMIRDEHAKVIRLKAMLRNKEQTLIERTKGQITMLEMRKRQLKINGNLDEIPSLKKKQRGLLLNLQQERSEIERMKKRYQKTYHDRKNILRNNRHLFRLHLDNHVTVRDSLARTDQHDTANNAGMSAGLPTANERRQHAHQQQNSGPMKGYDLGLNVSKDAGNNDTFSVILSHREKELQKRRSHVEALLRWSKRLDEKEREITQMESRLGLVKNTADKMIKNHNNVLCYASTDTALQSQLKTKERGRDKRIINRDLMKSDNALCLSKALDQGNITYRTRHIEADTDLSDFMATDDSRVMCVSTHNLGKHKTASDRNRTTSLRKDLRGLENETKSDTSIEVPRQRYKPTVRFDRSDRKIDTSDTYRIDKTKSVLLNKSVRNRLENRFPETDDSDFITNKNNISKSKKNEMLEDVNKSLNKNMSKLINQSTQHSAMFCNDGKDVLLTPSQSRKTLELPDVPQYVDGSNFDKDLLVLKENDNEICRQPITIMVQTQSTDTNVRKNPELKSTNYSQTESNVLCTVPMNKSLVEITQDKFAQTSEHANEKKVKGSDLNRLWRHITGSKLKKYNDDQYYSMSKQGLENFYEGAKMAAMQQFSENEDTILNVFHNSSDSTENTTTNQMAVSDNLYTYDSHNYNNNPATENAERVANTSQVSRAKPGRGVDKNSSLASFVRQDTGVSDIIAAFNDLSELLKKRKRYHGNSNSKSMENFELSLSEETPTTNIGEIHNVEIVQTNENGTISLNSKISRLTSTHSLVLSIRKSENMKDNDVHLSEIPTRPVDDILNAVNDNVSTMNGLESVYSSILNDILDKNSQSVVTAQSSVDISNIRISSAASGQNDTTSIITSIMDEIMNESNASITIDEQIMTRERSSSIKSVSELGKASIIGKNIQEINKIRRTQSLKSELSGTKIELLQNDPQPKIQYESKSLDTSLEYTVEFPKDSVPSMNSAPTEEFIYTPIFSKDATENSIATDSQAKTVDGDKSSKTDGKIVSQSDLSEVDAKSGKTSDQIKIASGQIGEIKIYPEKTDKSSIKTDKSELKTDEKTLPTSDPVTDFAKSITDDSHNTENKTKEDGPRTESISNRTQSVMFESKITENLSETTKTIESKTTDTAGNSAKSAELKTTSVEHSTTKSAQAEQRVVENRSESSSKEYSKSAEYDTTSATGTKSSNNESPKTIDNDVIPGSGTISREIGTLSVENKPKSGEETSKSIELQTDIDDTNIQNDLTSDESDMKSKEDRTQSDRSKLESPLRTNETQANNDEPHSLTEQSTKSEQNKQIPKIDTPENISSDPTSTDPNFILQVPGEVTLKKLDEFLRSDYAQSVCSSHVTKSINSTIDMIYKSNDEVINSDTSGSLILTNSSPESKSTKGEKDKTGEKATEDNSSITHKQDACASTSLDESNVDKGLNISNEYDSKSTNSNACSGFTHGDKSARKTFDDLYARKALLEGGNTSEPAGKSHEHDTKSTTSSENSAFNHGDKFERKNFDDLFKKKSPTENEDTVKLSEKSVEYHNKSANSSANSTYGGQFDRRNFDNLYLRKAQMESGNTIDSKEKCIKHDEKKTISPAISRANESDRDNIEGIYGIKTQMESQNTIKPIEKLEECDTKLTTATATPISTHGVTFERTNFGDLLAKAQMGNEDAIEYDDKCEEIDAQSEANSAFTHREECARTNFDDLYHKKSQKEAQNILSKHPKHKYIENEDTDQEPFQFGVVMDKARLIEHSIITSDTETNDSEKSNVCVKKVVGVAEEINNITHHSVNVIDMHDTIEENTHPEETFIITDRNLTYNFVEDKTNDLKNGLVKIDDGLKYLNETFEKVPVIEKPMSSPRYESDFESNVFTSDSDCANSARTENMEVSPSASLQIEMASENYMSVNQQNDPEDPFASICLSRNMAKYATQVITSNGHPIFAGDDEPDPENPTTSIVMRQNVLLATNEGLDAETVSPNPDFQIFQTENDPNNPYWSGAFSQEFERDPEIPVDNIASTSHEDQAAITTKSKTILDKLCKKTKEDNKDIIEGIKDSSRRLDSSVEYAQQKLHVLKQLNDLFLLDNKANKNVLESLIRKAADPGSLIQKRVSFSENIVESDNSINYSSDSESHGNTSKKSDLIDGNMSTAHVTDETKAIKAKLLKTKNPETEYEGSVMPLTTEDLYFDKSIATVDMDIEKVLRPHRKFMEDFHQRDDKAVQILDTEDAIQQCITSVHQPTKKDYEVYIYAGTQTAGGPSAKINHDLLTNTGCTNQINENATQTSQELVDANNIEQSNTGKNEDEEYQLYLYAGTQSISPEHIHFIDPEKDNSISKIYKIIPNNTEQQQQQSNLDVSYPSTLQSIESIEHDLDKSLSAIENQLKNDNASVRITGLVNENIIEPIYTNVSKSDKKIDQEQHTSAVAGSANIVSVKNKNDVPTTSSSIDNHPDVKKRVQEILEAAAINKSPVAFNSTPARVQDLWITTNENLTPSPGNSPPVSPHSLGTEAELLRRKQFEIEQEIKRLQQQSEQMEFYVREIPNKPPPPYTPPPQQSVSQFQDALTATSFQPGNPENHPQVSLHGSDNERIDNKPLTKAETEALIIENTQILYDAFRTGQIAAVDFKDSNINEKLVFDLCKEVIIDHFKCSVDVPVWLRGKRILPRHVYYRLEDLTNFVKQKVLQFMNFESDATSIYRLGHKYPNTGRREVRMERNDWKTQDSDYEQLCKENATNCILNMLLSETADVVAETFKKKHNKKS